MRFLLLMAAMLIVKCTKGAGVRDYSSRERGGGGGEKNWDTVNLTSVQLSFKERVVSET